MNQIVLLLALMLTYSACPNFDERCSSCSDNQCLACYDSYVNEKGLCEAVKEKVENCLSYESETHCKFCQHGFFVKDGKCVKIAIDNCVEVELNDPTKCVMCDEGIKVVDGKCDSQNLCDIEACLYCTNIQGVSQCALCQQGYVLEEGENIKCINETQNLTNCFLKNKNEDKCSVCDINYFYNDGTCLRSSAYQASYDLKSMKENELHSNHENVNEQDHQVDTKEEQMVEEVKEDVKEDEVKQDEVKEDEVKQDEVKQDEVMVKEDEQHEQPKVLLGLPVQTEQSKEDKEIKEDKQDDQQSIKNKEEKFEQLEVNDEIKKPEIKVEKDSKVKILEKDQKESTLNLIYSSFLLMFFMQQITKIIILKLISLISWNVWPDLRLFFQQK